MLQKYQLKIHSNVQFPTKFLPLLHSWVLKCKVPCHMQTFLYLFINPQPSSDMALRFCFRSPNNRRDPKRILSCPLSQLRPFYLFAMYLFWDIRYKIILLRVIHKGREQSKLPNIITMWIWEMNSGSNELKTGQLRKSEYISLHGITYFANAFVS